MNISKINKDIPKRKKNHLSLLWKAFKISSNYAKTKKKEHHYHRYIFDMGHSSYDFVTVVKTRYLLTNIAWLYCELRSRLHWGLMLFWSWPLTNFRLDCGLKSGYHSEGEGGSTCKGKISVQIKPWRLVHFSSDIFLAQSSLGRSLIYYILNFYNLRYAHRVWFSKI